MSSQIGWPDGASAEWPATCPSASPTTCDVAAVPRNWQPPPGDAQARQPSSAACFERDLAVREARADRLDRAGVLALARRQRHAAGHEHARQIAARRPAPSSSPAAPCRRSRRRARRAASAAIESAGGRPSPRRCDTAGCRTSPACPACGRRTDRCTTPANGIAPARLELPRRRLHQQPDLPVAGVIAERDRRAVGGADAAVRATGSGTPCRRAPTDPSPCRRSASSRRGRRTAACAASPP